MAYHEIDGALFRDPPANDGKRHPVMHLALEVLGVRMQVAVWPAEKSVKGVQYWPVSGQYARGEARRLVPMEVAQVQAQGAPGPDGQQADDSKAASPSDGGEILPS